METPAPPFPSALATDLLTRAAFKYTFSFTPFLQKTYQHSLPSDRPVCPAFAAGHCPLKTHCPQRHPSNINIPGQHSDKSKDPATAFGNMVCKHWLRGLCKKGDACEFLHEYNLRRMPECNFFVRNGHCSNGDECLYLHVDPSSRVAACPHYERGFCPLGPRCEKKHARRRICLCYLAGFCPEGNTCREGAHPRWVPDREMERPRMKREEEKGEEDEKRDAEVRERERERDGEGRFDRQGGYKDRFGRGGRWRGGKNQRFRGRGR